MYIISFIYVIECNLITNIIGVTNLTNNDSVFDQNRVVIENITKNTHI